MDLCVEIVRLPCLLYQLEFQLQKEEFITFLQVLVHEMKERHPTCSSYCSLVGRVRSNIINGTLISTNIVI